MKRLLRITPPALGKFNLSGILCALLLLASCSSDDEPAPLNPDETRTVTITVSATDEMQTRAISEDEDDDITRCLIQVGTDGTPDEMQASDNGATYTYTTTLPVGQPVTFLFWADGGSAYYTADNLTAVTQAPNAPYTGIAYATSATWNGTDQSITANLQLVVSKVTLKTTTDIPAGNSVSVTLTGTFTGYDVATDSYTGTATSRTYTHDVTTDLTGAGEANPVEVFSFYVLTDADQAQDITVACGSLTTTVNGINIAPGQQLLLTGDVGSRADMTLDITASISDSWEQVSIYLDPVKLTDDTAPSTSLTGSGTEEDPYLIRSAADLLFYMSAYGTSHRGSYTRLETDIDIQTTSWQSNVLWGTFDGDGHTIRGTMNCEVVGDRIFGGFFQSLSSGGTVRNLHVEADLNVEGTLENLDAFVGGIAGNMQYSATISDCTYSGTVTAAITTTTSGNINVGGIAGRADESTVSGCTHSGTIDTSECSAASGSNIYVGGIAGYSWHSTLTDNTNSGTPTEDVGGVTD